MSTPSSDRAAREARAEAIQALEKCATTLANWRARADRDLPPTMTLLMFAREAEQSALTAAASLREDTGRERQHWLYCPACGQPKAVDGSPVHERGCPIRDNSERPAPEMVDGGDDAEILRLAVDGYAQLFPFWGTERHRRLMLAVERLAAGDTGREPSPDSGQREPCGLCDGRGGSCPACNGSGYAPRSPQTPERKGGDPPDTVRGDSGPEPSGAATSPRSPDVVEGGDARKSAGVRALFEEAVDEAFWEGVNMQSGKTWVQGTETGTYRLALEMLDDLLAARQPVTDAEQVGERRDPHGPDCPTHGWNHPCPHCERQQAASRQVETAGDERNEIMKLLMAYRAADWVWPKAAALSFADQIIGHLARLPSTEDGERELPSCPNCGVRMVYHTGDDEWPSIGYRCPSCGYDRERSDAEEVRAAIEFTIYAGYQRRAEALVALDRLARRSPAPEEPAAGEIVGNVADTYNAGFTVEGVAEFVDDYVPASKFATAPGTIAFDADPQPAAEPPAAEDEDVRRLFSRAFVLAGHPTTLTEREAFAALDRLIAERDRLRTLVERQKAMIEDLDRQHIERDGGP